MLEKETINNIIKKFEGDYTAFKNAHSKMKKHNNHVKRWAKKNDISTKDVFNITFDEWNIKHQAEIKVCDKLLKSIRKLIVLLLTQKIFGNDIFRDYDVEIHVKYRNAHHCYLK